ASQGSYGGKEGLGLRCGLELNIVLAAQPLAEPAAFDGPIFLMPVDRDRGIGFLVRRMEEFCFTSQPQQVSGLGFSRGSFSVRSRDGRSVDDSGHGNVTAGADVIIRTVDSLDRRQVSNQDLCTLLF